MTNPITNLLRQNIEKFPDKPLFIFPKNKTRWKTITYKQFSLRLNLYSNGIASQKFSYGTRIVVMLPPSVDMFALVFALLENGMVPVFIDPAIGLTKVARCIEEAKPEVYIGSRITNFIRYILGWGKNNFHHIFSLEELILPVDRFSSFPMPEQNQQDEAAIVFTSGSTGLPKGAVYSIKNFFAQVNILKNALKLTGSEIDLPAFTLFAMIDCILGVTSVIPDMRFPSPAQVNPSQMINAIKTHQVNTLFVSPAALKKLCSFGEKNSFYLPSLYKVITAGAPAPAEIQESFLHFLPPEAELINVYGATEALPISTIKSQDILQKTQFASAEGAGICVGYPVDGININIIPISNSPVNPENFKILPANEAGEIIVSGMAVTKKYAGNEQATLNAKIFLDNNYFFHRTGDLGYLDNQKRLWYCGRKSQLVTINAHIFFTEKVEGIFNAHPAVHRSALVGAKKGDITEAILWIEIKKNKKINKQQLIKELNELAIKYLQPNPIKQIMFHTHFPTDVRHNSKIIREKLAALAEKNL